MLKNNFSYQNYIFFFNLFALTFYYYIYNILSLNYFVLFNLILLLINLKFCFEYIANFSNNLKKLNSYFKIFLIFVIIITIINFSSLILNVNNFKIKNIYELYRLKIISPEILIFPLGFFSLFYFSFYKNKKKLFNKSINFFLILIIFIYSLALIKNVLFPEDWQKNWANPLLELSLINDYFSSKLQHAYIFFVLFSYYCINYLKEKNKLKENIIIAYSLFLLIIINSKMFYAFFGIFMIYFFLFELIKKKSIIKFFQISIFLVIFFSLFINLMNLKNPNQKMMQTIFDNIYTKFFYEFNYFKIKQNNNEVILFIKNLRKVKNDQDAVYFFNSSEERSIRIDYCKKNVPFFNKNMASIIGKSKYSINEKKIISNKPNNSNLDLNDLEFINCESTFFQYYNKYGTIIIVLFFLTFVILIIFLMISKFKLLNIMFMLIYFLMFRYHHVFFNTVFFVHLLIIYNLNDNKKLNI